MKTQTIVLLFLANGFVSFYFWTMYQHGMSGRRAVPEYLLSLIGVNLALVLGRKLAEHNTGPRRSR